MRLAEVAGRAAMTRGSLTAVVAVAWRPQQPLGYWYYRRRRVTFEVLQRYYYVLVTRIHSRWNAAFLLHRPKVSAIKTYFLSENCIYNLRLAMIFFLTNYIPFWEVQ